ncbi:MAG TPA: 4'-phosphopantetheinyl transferase superfamily protein [Gammaproteobacteria bacterium]|nr:4'-phosphopantetheinyl transferase superfamily protein [Gammaproteobacteria bacterium]
MDGLQFYRLSKLQELQLFSCADMPARQPPQVGHLHLWAVDLDHTHHTAIEKNYYQWLSAREQLRLNRYHSGVVHNRHAAIMLALRAILSHYLDCPLNAFDYQYGSHGKPAVAGYFGKVGVSFNSTDSRNLALIAVTAGAELGVDLEYLDRRLHSMHLLKRICGAMEGTQLQQGTSTSKRLLQCWTRKEAWGKALGVGIRYPLPSIPICLGLSWPNCRIYSSCGVWQLLTLQPEQPWLASVVVAGVINHIQYRLWHMSQAGI